MEQFKDVNGFEGLYQISNKGRLFKCKNGIPVKQIGIPRTKSTINYTHTSLKSKEGGRYEVAIHRLVAEAFLENPNNLPCVNHIDGNKHNNCVDNLEWVSYSENSQHAVDNGLYNFKIENTMDQFSFQKGFSQVKVKDVSEVKSKIMQALCIKNKMSWYQRLNGVIEPKVSEAKMIETIFEEYGITEVWGK